MSTLLTKVYTNRYLNSYAKSSWRRVKSVEQVAPSPTHGVWIRLIQYRVPYAPLSEYPEPVFFQFLFLFWGGMEGERKSSCFNNLRRKNKHLFLKIVLCPSPILRTQSMTRNLQDLRKKVFGDGTDKQTQTDTHTHKKDMAGRLDDPL